LAKLNGEDKWMLPELDAQLSGKSKKSKKEKKHKKDKKHKKSKKKDNSSDSDEWVEKTSETTEPASSAPLERDEWMSVPSLLPIFSKSSMPPKRTSLNKNEEIARKTMMEKPGQSSRELNPYWKNGGTGLPPERTEAESSKRHVSPHSHVLSSNPSERKKQRISDRDSTHVSSRDRSRSRERKHPENIRKSSTVQERFRRPSESDEVVSHTNKRFSSSQPGWKKNEAKSSNPVDSSTSSSSSESEEEKQGTQPPQEDDKIWTEQELNALGAKIIKAEIMGQAVIFCILHIMFSFNNINWFVGCGQIT
jgi:hypothetical protein